MNCKSLKVSDFCKGVVYATYLSPTYVNILTIYAISNIHDVTWGSRDVEQTKTFKDVEKKKSILYRNFRSNFLIFWLIINTIAGYGIITMSRGGSIDIILFLGTFLILIMIFKITFSTIHMCKAKCDRAWVRRTIRKRKSTVFDNIENKPMADKNDVFVVYFEEDGNDIRITNGDDPNFKNAAVKSAIKDQNTYRGFNLAKLNERHRISQGLIENLFAKNLSYYGLSESESAEVPLDQSSSLIRESDDSTPIGTNTRIFSTNYDKSEGKTKFDVSSEAFNTIEEDIDDSLELEDSEIEDSEIEDDGFSDSSSLHDQYIRQETARRMVTGKKVFLSLLLTNFRVDILKYIYNSSFYN